MGDKNICRAYLNLCSYEYFVKERPTQEIIFKRLKGRWDLERKWMKCASWRC